MAQPSPDAAAPSGPVTNVAVGVVFRNDGAVLLGQRMPGKPYAGWWEFPGGKFEAGEDAAQALARELDEELGVRVHESLAWVVREHVYAHAHVRLHFRRVMRWDGEVVSREGQAFVWRHPAAIDVAPLLPAAIAPVTWLALPARYAISNAGELGVGAFLAQLAMRLRSRAVPQKLLQLREPTLREGDFERLFTVAVELAREAGARLLVSSRHQSRFWDQAGEMTGGGVHLTGRDLAALANGAGRPGLPLVGASCHQPQDLVLAGRVGADLAVFGPVKPTASHPTVAPMGWPAFREGVAATPVPVYALGGLGEDDVGQALRHGAHGVAMQRTAWRD